MKEQSVGMKTGGSEPAVSDRMVSTFCSRKLRKSEAENVEQLVVCFDGSPRIVETDRHSFFGLDELDITIFSHYSFSLEIECRILVPKSLNPSKPVKWIFGSTITTLQ